MADRIQKPVKEDANKNGYWENMRSSKGYCIYLENWTYLGIDACFEKDLRGP